MAQSLAGSICLLHPNGATYNLHVQGELFTVPLCERKQTAGCLTYGALCTNVSGTLNMKF